VELEWRALPPAARLVWRLGGAGAAGAVALLGVGLALASGVATAAIAATAIALVVGGLSWWLADRRWAAWGYAERELDLVLRHGVLVRRLTIVPYGRMQFVDVRQGPLARALGVSTVKLHTAAAATDAEIPMLDDAEATRLRDRLTALGEAHAAGV
jgi:uncharacterized protein